MLTPYWEGQQAKERANELYKRGLHGEAVDVYGEALAKLKCHSTTLALNLYNNRAAAYQQMGRHTEALRDSLFVLRYDVVNAKALARKER